MLNQIRMFIEQLRQPFGFMQKEISDAKQAVAARNI